MANVNESVQVKKDWLPLRAHDWALANPWLWLGTGFVLTLASWLWTVTAGEAGDERVILLAIGLLFASVGMATRWRHQKIAYLLPWRAPVALLLSLVFTLLGLAVTGVFLMPFYQWDEYGTQVAPLFLVWISTVPACFFAARRCLTRSEADDGQAMQEEVAFGFAVLAGICLLGSYTLYIDADPGAWDTLRMFLRVMTAVSLFASALTLVSTVVRRVLLSMLIVLHFIGINTAALSAPPAPWIAQQMWIRCFRPYLDFVYLNNAYHFYAPEPGPASYIWFRVIFESPDGKSTEGMWYKVPHIDENGNIQHPVALEYQRYLAMTEQASQPGMLPAETIFNAETGQWEYNPFYSRRWKLQPNQQEPVVVGKVQPAQLRVPLHPALLPWTQQAFVPNPGAVKLLSSYARWVAHKFPVDPEKSKWTFKSVKVYRVVHAIPPVHWFLNEIPPTDPELYRPYYVGNYDSDGKMIIDQDPYLYWLLPSIRDNQNDPDSQIRDYARLHAGDHKWIRRGSDRQWVEPKDADKP